VRERVRDCVSVCASVRVCVSMRVSVLCPLYNYLRLSVFRSISDVYNRLCTAHLHYKVQFVYNLHYKVQFVYNLRYKVQFVYNLHNAWKYKL
jgi:hypothetical protein